MKNLNNPPRYTRFSGAAGIKSAATPIERSGGHYGAGLIKGFSVITRGEALGHGMWCDAEFLQQVAAEINASDGGRKSRFTHPGLSSDGLGKGLGRTKNAIVDGDIVRADQHFSRASHRTPDGDLANYVMDLASESPEDFGASIVFEHDIAARNEFLLMHGGQYDADLGWFGFKSPDPDNVNNYPHARLVSLRAVDIVDQPAANPAGMFHREQEVAAEAESLVAYALGLSKEKPASSEFGIDADRVSKFVTSFIQRHSLSLVPVNNEEGNMPDPQKPAETPATPVETPAEVKPAEVPAETPPVEAPVEKPAEAPLSEGAKFLAKFGDKGGIWFAQGKSFDECRDLFASELTAKVESQDRVIADLKTKLGALRGEEKPVEFTAEQTQDQKAFADKVNVVGSPGLAAFAASLNVGKAK